jgi:hypothetical protein
MIARKAPGVMVEWLLCVRVATATMRMKHIWKAKGKTDERGNGERFKHSERSPKPSQLVGIDSATPRGQYRVVLPVMVGVCDCRGGADSRFVCEKERMDGMKPMKKMRYQTCFKTDLIADALDRFRSMKLDLIEGRVFPPMKTIVRFWQVAGFSKKNARIISKEMARRARREKKYFLNLWSKLGPKKVEEMLA